MTRLRRTGLDKHFPEPTRFWISHAPRKWQAAEGLWTDLGGGRLRGLDSKPETESVLPALDVAEFEGLLFIPPVAPGLERGKWLKEIDVSATSLLVELQPGEGTDLVDCRVVYDLLRPLLAGDVDRLAQLPRGASAVWPLIPALTDSTELWERGCATLAASGVACVQPLAVELEAADRRHLVEIGGEAAFDALFHGHQPSEREFSRCAHRHGLAAFTPRPVTGYSPRQIRNRRLGGDLALAGELWLRLERPVGIGQSLLYAAREAEHTKHDLKALALEENLEVLTWLNAESLDLIREVTVNDNSALLTALLEEYLLD